MSRLLDRAVDFRESHPELDDRWIDVSYYDLVQDPMAVVRSVYDRSGWTPESGAADTVVKWLGEQREPRRKETRHKYDIADYGLTSEMVDEAFARYRDFLTSTGMRASGGR